MTIAMKTQEIWICVSHICNQRIKLHQIFLTKSHTNIHHEFQRNFSTFLRENKEAAAERKRKVADAGEKNRIDYLMQTKFV